MGGKVDWCFFDGDFGRGGEVVEESKMCEVFMVGVIVGVIE